MVGDSVIHSSTVSNKIKVFTCMPAVVEVSHESNVMLGPRAFKYRTYMCVAARAQCVRVECHTGVHAARSTCVLVVDSFHARIDRQRRRAD